MIDKLIEKYKRQYRVLSQEIVDDLLLLKKELEKPQETPVEKTIDELRVEYKEKFQKNPFN
jgi:hypothetical protein